MVRAISTVAIGRSTGRPWEDWQRDLDARGAAKLEHGEIVALAREIAGIDNWWAQSVAIAYQQAIGRRRPGEASDGTFSVSITRVRPGPPDRIAAAWRRLAAELSAVADVALDGTPTESLTPKRHYWRCKLADGSRVTVTFEPKAAAKTLVAVEHSRCRSPEVAASRKAFWAARLEQLAPG